MAFSQILIVGLGNVPLPMTRHSVGHVVVDALASRFGIHMTATREGYLGQRHVKVGNDDLTLTLFKSKSLMNVSGSSIATVLRKTVKSPRSMIIVQDSLSHNIKSLSVKFGGSANGHNGVKSVISALGGELGFYRFRIGIGRGNGIDAAEYVLHKLTPQERQFWGGSGEGLDLVVRELSKVANQPPG